MAVERGKEKDKIHGYCYLCLSSCYKINIIYGTTKEQYFTFISNTRNKHNKFKLGRILSMKLDINISINYLIKKLFFVIMTLCNSNSQAEFLSSALQKSHTKFNLV